VLASGVAALDDDDIPIIMVAAKKTTQRLLGLRVRAGKETMDTC
jgi:hypothetical protein